MSAQKPVVPILTEKERKELEAMVRKRTSPQRLVERARIILTAADRSNIAATAKELGVVKNTVRKWCRRWVARPGASIPERLAEAPRPRAPTRITPEQICRILALACTPPEQCGRPITHWSEKELAQEAVKQGIVDSISQRTVGRFLKSGRHPTPPQPLLVDRQARRAQGGKNHRCLHDIRRSGGAGESRRKERVH